jgi:hypothetical protein
MGASKVATLCECKAPDFGDHLCLFYCADDHLSVLMPILGQFLGKTPRGAWPPLSVVEDKRGRSSFSGIAYSDNGPRKCPVGW